MISNLPDSSNLRVDDLISEIGDDVMIKPPTGRSMQQAALGARGTAFARPTSGGTDLSSLTSSQASSVVDSRLVTPREAEERRREKKERKHRRNRQRSNDPHAQLGKKDDGG